MKGRLWSPEIYILSYSVDFWAPPEDVTLFLAGVVEAINNPHLHTGKSPTVPLWISNHTLNITSIHNNQPIKTEYFVTTITLQTSNTRATITNKHAPNRTYHCKVFTIISINTISPN